MDERRGLEWLTATTFAHRGLHDAFVPENTLAAAEAAIAAGLGIECDVQRTLEGSAYVFHDWDALRLTGRPERLDELDDAAFSALKLGGSDEGPTNLGDFLKAIAGRVPVLIEIKSNPGYDPHPTCRQVLRALEGYRAPHAIMSFDPAVPRWFLENSRETIRGLVGTDSLPNGFEGVWRNSDNIEQSRPDFLAIDRRDLARSEARAWRGEGRPLLSWTIRSLEERLAAQALADALIVEGEGVP
jgi:glycerophosphoryl diester phosphodiesterase